ncbi:MAG: S26 family signal peptidase [Planctomycetota bacterium]
MPPGHVFVCGDNDPISVDSRHWGAIRRGDLLGRVIEISVAP